MSTLSIGELFSRSIALLRTNPILIMPGVITGILLAALHAVFFPRPAVWGIAGVGNAVISGFVFLLITNVTTLLANVATTSLAANIWERGSATSDDVRRTFQELGPRHF